MGGIRVNKYYVDVILKYSKDDIITPLAIIWEDGHKYEIDKVLSIDKKLVKQVDLEQDIDVEYKDKKEIYILMNLPRCGLLNLKSN